MSKDYEEMSHAEKAGWWELRADQQNMLGHGDDYDDGPSHSYQMARKHWDLQEQQDASSMKQTIRHDQ
jgi:hypothetical protein